MLLCVQFIRLPHRFTGFSRFVPLGYHYFCIPNLRLTNSNYLWVDPTRTAFAEVSVDSCELAVVAVGGLDSDWDPPKMISRDWDSNRASSRNSNPKTTIWPRPQTNDSSFGETIYH